MNCIVRTIGFPAVAAVFSCLAASSFAEAPAALDTARIERLTGVKGALDAKEGVFKVSVPRDDLSVSAAGVRITPPMGLTSWAAFQRAGTSVMVMGDLVLLEDQVNPVMSAALDAGLEVTALHNHFFWEAPRVMFMHVGGSGDEERLAAAVGRVFARMKETAGGAGEIPRGVDTTKGPVTAARIDAILGRTGTLAAGVYKVVIGRTARMHDGEVGAAMGVNTWAAFAGSDERAVVDGDFAMLESELQPVLKALRRAGILVVAIHQHMTHEEPRMVFLHYWGTGRAEDLAMGLKAALGETGGERRADAGGVVFVCEHGSVKSLIAAHWFNRLAAERGLTVRAVSRGLTPDAAVPPAIVGALAADGFDVHGYLPRALGEADLAGTRVVALGAALDRPGVAVERWDAIPPATERYEESRTAIRRRVEALLDRIQSGR